jgi:hypothetical protein
VTRQNTQTGRHSAFIHIERIAADPDIPVGRKIETLDAIVKAADAARRRMLMQIGADLAKYMAANGHIPDGRTVGEHLADGAA